MNFSWLCCIMACVHGTAKLETTKLPFTKIWPVCQMGLFQIKLGVPYNNWPSYTIHMKTKPMNYRFLDLAQLINGGNQGSSSVSENLKNRSNSASIASCSMVFSTKKWLYRTLNGILWRSRDSKGWSSCVAGGVFPQLVAGPCRTFGNFQRCAASWP